MAHLCLPTLQTLVMLFGREVAYVGVQRRPQLMDRDPHELAARLLQMLAAVDAPRPSAPAHPTGPQSTGPAARSPSVPDAPPALSGDATAADSTAVLAAAVAARGRTASRVLEEAPEVLDLELADVRQRVTDLSASLDWGGGQVCPCIQHASPTLTAVV